MLTPEAKANNIPELDFLCTPCINFGGFYCYDDPWKVNFNGDKCYEYAVDRLNCDNFKFTNDINDCIQGKLQVATACEKDELARVFEEYRMPNTMKIKLEPRSMCSLTILSYRAILSMSYIFPIVLHHSEEGKVLTHLDGETMQWDRSRDVTNNCLKGSCT